MTEPVNFFAAINRPKTVWTGRVSGLATGMNNTVVNYYNGAYTSYGYPYPATLTVDENQTIWFGTSGVETFDKGLARLRRWSSGTTGNITVGYNSDVTPFLVSGTHITIKQEHRIWSKYPRVVLGATGSYTLYEDYDLTVTGSVFDNNVLPPVAVVGPPAVGLLDTISVSGTYVAQVTFMEDSYGYPTGTSLWTTKAYLTGTWVAEGSWEGTQTIGLNPQTYGGVWYVPTYATVTFTWDTPGTYQVSLSVVDTITGKRHKAYTNVFIFSPDALLRDSVAADSLKQKDYTAPRTDMYNSVIPPQITDTYPIVYPVVTGTSLLALNQIPLNQIDQITINGDYQRGGYSCSFTVYDDAANVSNIPDGAQVVIFNSGNLYHLGLVMFLNYVVPGFVYMDQQWSYRNNINFVGYITKASITSDWKRPNPIKFDAVSADGIIRNLSNYSAILYDVSGTATVWSEMHNMTPQKVFHFLTTSRSTISEAVPITKLNYKSQVGSNTFLKTRDISAGSMWDSMDQLAKNIFCHIFSSAYGVIYSELDFGVLTDDELPRGFLTVYGDQDELPRFSNSIGFAQYIDAVEMEELHYWANPVASLKLDGVYYPGDGNAAHQVPLFSLAPGIRSKQIGQVQTESGYILDGLAYNVNDRSFATGTNAQSWLNKRSGRKLAKLNNPYPNFSATFINDGRFDIAPQTVCEISTRNSRFYMGRVKGVARRVSHTFNSKDGYMKTRVDFELRNTDAHDGETFIMDYPEDAVGATAINVAAPATMSTPTSFNVSPRQAPVLVSASKTNTTATVSWLIAPNASMYYAERSINGMSWSQVTGTYHPTVSLSDAGLVSGTTYYYRVRAYNTLGYSPYSNIVATA